MYCTTSSTAHHLVSITIRRRSLFSKISNLLIFRKAEPVLLPEEIFSHLANVNAISRDQNGASIITMLFYENSFGRKRKSFPTKEDILESSFFSVGVTFMSVGNQSSYVNIELLVGKEGKLMSQEGVRVVPCRPSL